MKTMNNSPRSARRLFVSSIASLSLIAFPVAAQQNTRNLPTCGDFEYIEWNGEIISRQILENCRMKNGLVVRGRYDNMIKDGSDHIVEGSSRDTIESPIHKITRDSSGSSGNSGEEIFDNVVEENSRNPVEEVPGQSADGSSGNWGIAIGGLALAGIAVAAGGGSSSSNTPSIPRVHPRTSPLPLPDDPMNPESWRTEEFNNQYGLGLIGVEHRFAQGARGQGTLGAIYDTGIDLAHGDVGGIRLDLSHSYIGDPDDLTDLSGHGTFVYGIAGATRNGTDIHGIAPDAEFMIFKNSKDSLIESFGDALRRVNHAGADAMNNSWALIQIRGPRLSPGDLLTPEGIGILRDTVRTGVSIVFATGNDGEQESQLLARIPVDFPEMQGNWIAVTALNAASDLQSANLASYANRCGTAMNWCLAAPGTNIRSLTVGGGTAESLGTSLAAPHVTGAILVLKSQFPEMTTPEIHEILFDTAVDLGAPGVDPVYGHGALNLDNAMTPQGAMTAELGETVNEATIPLSMSWIKESAITGGTLAAALSDQNMLVTDGYDRGYFASMGPRIATDSFLVSPDLQASIAAAFTISGSALLEGSNHPEISGHSGDSDISGGSGHPETGYDLRLDSFGMDHDVTRIAHIDPVMALVSQTEGTEFSLRAPIGKATLSMANVTTLDGNAVSLGAALPLGDNHSITVSLGHAKETDSILGAKAYGAFAGLESDTFYGRVETDFALDDRITLNGSVTTGRTSFRSTGLLSRGRADSLATALGVTFNDALAQGDQLSFAVAQPFAVSGGSVTLKSGTGISAAEHGQRTNRISYTENTVSLGKADRAPEVHLGYLHNFETRRWDRAGLAFGGVAQLDGGARVAAARVALTFGF